MQIAASLLVGILLGLGLPSAFEAERTEALSSATSFFNDVEGGSYYDSPLLEMVHRGIIKGYGKGLFGPHDAVTRAQLATVIARYHKRVVEPLYERVRYLEAHLDVGECGDGNKGPNEECDDGNTVNGDGCTAECQREDRPEPTPVEKCVPCGAQCVPNEQAMRSICPYSEFDFDCQAVAGKCKKIPHDKPPFERCEICGDQCYTDRMLEASDCPLPTDRFSCMIIEKECVKIPELPKPRIPICKEGQKLEKDCPNDAFNRWCEWKCVPDHSKPIGCSRDAKVCPDGVTTVGRNKNLDCEFDPCPSMDCMGDNDCPSSYRCSVETRGECLPLPGCDDSSGGCIEVCYGKCEKECTPYVCEDGTSHPRCTEDGHPINYFVDPCLSDDASCGNGICEIGEAKELLCPPCTADTPPEECQCLEACPEDCTEPAKRCANYTLDGETKEICATCGDGVCEPFETCTSSFCGEVEHSGEKMCTTDCGRLYCPDDCG